MQVEVLLKRVDIIYCKGRVTHLEVIIVCAGQVLLCGGRVSLATTKFLLVGADIISAGRIFWVEDIFSYVGAEFFYIWAYLSCGRVVYHMGRPQFPCAGHISTSEVVEATFISSRSCILQGEVDLNLNSCQAYATSQITIKSRSDLVCLFIVVVI